MIIESLHRQITTASCRWLVTFGVHVFRTRLFTGVITGGENEWSEQRLAEAARADAGRYLQTVSTLQLPLTASGELWPVIVVDR